MQGQLSFVKKFLIKEMEENDIVLMAQKTNKFYAREIYILFLCNGTKYIATFRQHYDNRKNPEFVFCEKTSKGLSDFLG